jgi:NAD(P)-dependent dehydrogenase (short-subunit alcohol dehydrogenase family)
MGPDGNLEGKTVLVTGATSGIGRATAEAFGRRGARVVVTGRDQSRGSEVAAGIGESSRFIAADLARSAEVRRLIGDVGAVDVLINNAGLVSFAPTHETGEDLIDKAVAVNVKAPFLLAGALAPTMVAAGGGAIVNVSTMVADFGMPGAALYGATKAALGAHQDLGGRVRAPGRPGQRRVARPGTHTRRRDLR